MEGTEQQVGAARSDLSIAIEPRRGECAGRQFQAEHKASGHVVEEAGVRAHDLDIADIFAVERLDLARKRGVGFGSQRAIGGGDAHHHTPSAIEVVLKNRHCTTAY